jgi:hypothetical protein
MSRGAAIGSLLGAAAGSVVPGVGTAVGMGIGSAVGNLVDTSVAKNKADNARPLMEDPEQRALLEEIRAKRMSTEMGTDITTQAAIGEVADAAEATRGSLVRATGGNAGQTVDALLKSQKMQQQGVNNAVAQAQTRIPFYTSLQDQMLDRLSQRKLELTLLDKAQAAAEEAQYGKENTMNIMSGVASGKYDELLNKGGNKVQSLLQNLFQNKGVEGTGVDSMTAPENVV